MRRDVETYGRRAKVAFDADWAEDAARRDFTINAIYLDPDGTIHDPVGGLADLAARRVRFVGDPVKRIAEDVLRLLRYYRFEARFGNGAGDPAARAACRAAAPLLPNLSAERVAQELTRLLAVADPVPALQHDGGRRRARGGVAGSDPARPTGTPDPLSSPHLRPPPLAATADPLLRLGALIEVDRDGAIALAERLKFSNAWRDRLADLAAPWPFDPDGGERTQRLASYRLGRDRYRDLALLAAADGLIPQRRLDELLHFAEAWAPPVFPLAGRDVTALGIPPGPRVGRLLAAVQQWWEVGDFTADRAACLDYLKEIADAG